MSKFQEFLNNLQDGDMIHRYDYSELKKGLTHFESSQLLSQAGFTACLASGNQIVFIKNLLVPNDLIRNDKGQVFRIL